MTDDPFARPLAKVLPFRGELPDLATAPIGCCQRCGYKAPLNERQLCGGCVSRHPIAGPGPLPPLLRRGQLPRFPMIDK